MERDSSTMPWVQGSAQNDTVGGDGCWAKFWRSSSGAEMLVKIDVSFQSENWQPTNLLSFRT